MPLFDSLDGDLISASRLWNQVKCKSTLLEAARGSCRIRKQCLQWNNMAMRLKASAVLGNVNGTQVFTYAKPSIGVLFGDRFNIGR